MNRLRSVIATITLLALSTQAQAQTLVERMIGKGVDWLRAASEKETSLGLVGLSTLALVKSGEKTDDPLIRRMLERLNRSVTDGVFHPDPNHGHDDDNYEAAIVLMALAGADADGFYTQIKAIAEYLISKQNPNGSWDYNDRTSGDTSQSQYAVLSLWEASGAGVDVPLKVWDLAMHWFMVHQDVTGGFCYHPTTPPGERRIAQDRQSLWHTMGVGGAGSLLICQSKLPLKKKIKIDAEMLIPVEKEASQYVPIVTAERAQEAVDLANRWMSNNMTVASPTGPGGLSYYLYGVERYAELAKIKTGGRSSWYDEGVKLLSARQASDGYWHLRSHENMTPLIDTSFCLLFLGRSTFKSLKRIKVFQTGAGTMVGGRGLPDPGGIGGAGSRRDPRFRNTLKAPVEDLLSAFDNPNALDVDQVATSLENASSEDISSALKGSTKRLRELARDQRPEARRAAMLALAKSKDYRVVPILIGGLSDPDIEVYKAAKDGLRFISRRMEGFGLTDEKPTDEQLAKAVKAWTEWYKSLKVEPTAEQKYEG